MKNLKSLQTDFYQLSMIAAYIFNDKANNKVGFEGFVRHIKPAVNPNENFYIFNGEQEIIKYIEIVKQEIMTEEFKETFLELIMPKVTADKTKLEIL